MFPYSGHFFLLKELVRRDFRGRYAGSLLGFLWSFAQPLWQLALFQFVFATVMKIRLPEAANTESFGIFLFCGLMPWLAIHEGVLRASSAVTDNADLVKKVHFPVAILVLSVVLGGLIHMGIAFTLFMALLVATGGLSPGGLPLLLLAVPLQVALTLGLGLLTCALNTFFRDVSQVLGMLLMGWFYATPIVYPLELAGDYRDWLSLNPLTALVTLYRQALLGGEIVWVDGTGRLALFALGVLALGGWLFHRLSPAFADEI